MPLNLPSNTILPAYSEHCSSPSVLGVETNDEFLEDCPKSETIRESVRQVIREAKNQTDGSPDFKLKIKPLYRKVEDRRLGFKLPWSSKEANIRHLLSVHAEFMHDENHYWTLTEEGWRGKYHPRKESQDMNRKAREKPKVRTPRMTIQSDREMFEEAPNQTVPLPNGAAAANLLINTDCYAQHGSPRAFNVNGTSMNYQQCSRTQGYNEHHRVPHASQYNRQIAAEYFDQGNQTGTFPLAYAPPHGFPQQQQQHHDRGPHNATDSRLHTLGWQAVNDPSFMGEGHTFQEQAYYQSQEHFESYWNG